MIIKTFLYKLYLLFPYAKGKRKKYFTGKEKSFLWRLWDLLSWILRDEQFNHNYYAFGLNLKCRRQRDYIGRSEFLKIKRHTERLLASSTGAISFSYDVICKDKFLSQAYMLANNISCIPVRALVNKETILLNGGETKPVSVLFSEKSEFVLKNIVLEAGDGYMLCKPLDENTLWVKGKGENLSGLKKVLGKSRWIMQNKIHSHQAIRKVNNTALNTTRIVTILNGSTATFICGFQSFATGGKGIDSWGEGAIYVGFNYSSDCLKDLGYYHPSIKDKALTDRHPDTKIIFEGYNVPYLKKAVELCLRAHKYFYHNFVIGWDVVITDEGPFILEANEKPGMNAVQCIDGGLRNKIKECYHNTLEYLKEK